VVGEEFHVWGAVEQDFTWDGRQRVRQIPQLVIPVRIRAVEAFPAGACPPKELTSNGLIADTVAGYVIVI